MFKKITLSFLFILFVCYLSYSQHMLEIEYRLHSELGKLSKNTPNEMLETFKEAQKHHSSFTFNLIASIDEASFFEQKKMNNDVQEFSYGLARIQMQVDNKYYYNITDDYVLKGFEAYGMKLITKNHISKMKWTLSNETRVIGKYTCYKALLKYKITNIEGEFAKEVIAWYCPEIPFNFGPKGYAGLPGLILELKDGNVTYTATQINFTTKNKKIKTVSGTLITEEELKRIGDKVREERSSNSKN